MDAISRVQVNGKEIILVPTAHVSQESIDLVKKVIEEERPDSVCIELDKKRYESMENPRAWEQTDLIKVIKTKQVGFMMANFALSSYQKKLAEKLGTTPGGEMRQGIESAKEVGAELILSDRDIQTTFLRIWRTLGFKEKYLLITSFIFSQDDEDEIEEEDLKKLMESDALEDMLADMGEELPTIRDILIHERDQFLSQKIKHAPGEKIVAVLGAAHVPGVTKELHNDIDLTEISAVPPSKPYLKIAGWLVPIVIIGIIFYGFTNNVQTGLDQLITWFLWSGGLSALFTLLVLGHPLSVLTSFTMALFSALNPVVAVGWFSGLVQASVKKPTVKDLHDAPDDIFSLKGIRRNKVIRVFLVVIFANIGSTLGTFIAGANIISNLFG